MLFISPLVSNVVKLCFFLKSWILKYLPSFNVSLYRTQNGFIYLTTFYLNEHLGWLSRETVYIYVGLKETCIESTRLFICIISRQVYGPVFLHCPLAAVSQHIAPFSELDYPACAMFESSRKYWRVHTSLHER